MLDLIPLHNKTTADEIYRAFVQVLYDFELNLNNFVSLTTDGAASMVGMKSGLRGRINELLTQNKIDDFHFLHCLIHQEAL